MSEKTRSGELDPSFGSNGIVEIVNPRSTHRITKRLPDNRLWTVVSERGLMGVRMYRHLADGGPDPVFRPDGVVVPLSGVTGHAFELTNFEETTTGRLIIAGSVRVQANETPTLMAVMSVDEDAELDPDFGTGGATVIELPDAISTFTHDMHLSDDRAVMLGRLLDTNDRGFTLMVRLTPAGQRDPSFGLNGVSRDFPTYANFRTLHILPDRKLALAGESTRSGVTGLVARYTSAGVPDTTYGTEGFTDIDFSSEFPGAAWSVVSSAVSPDGSHVVQGNSNEGGGQGVWLSRLTPNGQFDNTFNGGKPVVTYLDGHGYTGLHLAVQADGKIVSAGQTQSFSELVLLRLNADGQHDASFGNGGVVIVTSIPPGSREVMASLDIQPDGKLLVCSVSRSEFDPEPFGIVLRRLLA
ncbi:hypothetical protein PAQ31011_03330 [Pandoraea aquatica]|uniref:Delta-60 repeat domain-containing protein n=2 Tax=Pandoraea aquatica TaxID=2508290 RepID=A0A5E4WMZ0_9BURK|nr:hypothetical protein PAQ31011_03330 [Pandoraea aquatica]